MMLVKLYRLNWVESRFSFLSLHFFACFVIPNLSYCLTFAFLLPSCPLFKSKLRRVFPGGCRRFFHCLHLNILSYLVQNCVIYFSSCVSRLQFLVGFNDDHTKRELKTKNKKHGTLIDLWLGVRKSTRPVKIE